MRELGQSVEYFVYPDEGHGFTRRANEALAWGRVVAFLRRWSTDPGSAN
jgi:dipeptidyl aminopeptidase/acylaminoacyl peptidase